MTAYLDHAATTPLRPEAAEAMAPFLTVPSNGSVRFGNPSGSHAVARAAREAVEDARETVAAALGAEPGEVVFTGSGTEADNLALNVPAAAGSRGPAGAGGPAGGRAVCTAVEHDAVLESVRVLGGTVVDVQADGVVCMEALEGALGPDVVVVSVMLANNEVGVIQPLDAVVELVRRRAPAAVVHTDAVQAFPWLDVATLAAEADMVAVSAHKFGGPQGVGALVLRRGVRPPPVIHGGGQERGMRSGTHNVAGIVGMAAAAEATVRQRQFTVARVGALRDRLADGLLRAVPGAVETGARDRKVAGSCHLRIPAVESEALLFLLDEAGICASAGSACASGALEPSHVLLAMGVPAEEALSALRLSLGWCSTDADVDLALEVVPAAVARLREEAPA